MRRFVSIALLLLRRAPRSSGSWVLRASPTASTMSPTVTPSFSGSGQRVRLVQIDTPEVFFGTECYGRQASATTKRLLPEGVRVRLAARTRDRPRGRLRAAPALRRACRTA